MSPLTTAQAAEIAGMTPAVFRAHMARERARGNELRLPPDKWPDQRSPLYDTRRVKAWAAKRNVSR